MIKYVYRNTGLKVNGYSQIINDNDQDDIDIQNKINQDIDNYK